MFLYLTLRYITYNNENNDRTYSNPPLNLVAAVRPTSWALCHLLCMPGRFYLVSWLVGGLYYNCLCYILITDLNLYLDSSECHLLQQYYISCIYIERQSMWSLLWRKQPPGLSWSVEILFNSVTTGCNGPWLIRKSVIVKYWSDPKMNVQYTTTTPL